MTNKKYELISDDTKVIGNTILYRIRLLRDIKGYPAGTLGGYIESENNLSHVGDCWVADQAYVWDGARIWGNALIQGGARIYGGAHIGGNALIQGDAQIYDNVRIFGAERISDTVRVFTAEEYRSMVAAARTRFEKDS